MTDLQLYELLRPFGRLLSMHLDPNNSRVSLLELQLEEEREKTAKEVARQKETAQEQIRKDATVAEIDRCRQRDVRFCKWSNSIALKRFLLVLEEFESRSYSETQSLTFGGVPWPTLDNPMAPSFGSSTTVTWEKVETFFRYVKNAMTVQEYRKLVEKVHRLFHPDKWRSRRILEMVHDSDLRRSLESSVNTIAQALTPLWRATKEENLF
ncbi:hypothetical protein C0991_003212 [Blastosporella zonata]|nr:hypothetical protein C0991_003212 [Blastosporella zonata]